MHPILLLLNLPHDNGLNGSNSDETKSQYTGFVMLRKMYLAFQSLSMAKICYDKFVLQLSTVPWGLGCGWGCPQCPGCPIS